MLGVIFELLRLVLKYHRLKSEAFHSQCEIEYHCITVYPVYPAQHTQPSTPSTAHPAYLQTTSVLAPTTSPLPVSSIPTEVGGTGEEGCWVLNSVKCSVA